MDPNILEQPVVPNLPVRSNLTPERTGYRTVFFLKPSLWCINRVGTTWMHPDAAVGVRLGWTAELLLSGVCGQPLNLCLRSFGFMSGSQLWKNIKWRKQDRRTVFPICLQLCKKCACRNERKYSERWTIMIVSGEGESRWMLAAASFMASKLSTVGHYIYFQNLLKVLENPSLWDWKGRGLAVGVGGLPRRQRRAGLTPGSLFYPSVVVTAPSLVFCVGNNPCVWTEHIFNHFWHFFYFWIILGLQKNFRYTFE